MKIAQKVKKVLKKVVSKGKSVKQNEGQPITKSDDHGDYVSEDNLDEISRDSISMYTCEMPEETITKMKMKSMVWKYLWLAHDDAKFYDEDLNCAKMELDVQQGTEMQLSAAVKSRDEVGSQNSRKDTQCVDRPISTNEFQTNEDYIDMEEPNYDDYMCYSSTLDGSCHLVPWILSSGAC